MDEIDDLLEAIRTFYSNLETLRGLEGPELLLPGRSQKYADAWQTARNAYTSVAGTVEAMDGLLATQKYRLDKGMRKYGRYSSSPLADEPSGEEE